MPREEVSDVAAIYTSLDYAWQAYQPSLPHSPTPPATTPRRPISPGSLPADIDAEIANIRKAIAQQAVYGDTLSVIGRRLPEFRPIPSWWQMLPFFTMKDYYAWARQHPELNAPSQQDIDHARALRRIAPRNRQRILPLLHHAYSWYQRTSQVPRERPIMIDIHAPHEAAHTWTDFFIHIATICVGLLIAIGLEQSVEALHHRHQRHQLEYDLRVEARKNLHIVDLDDKFYDDKTAALTALRRYIEDTRTRRIAKLPPPIQPPPELGSPLFGFPITSTWKTAKESSLVPLLPRNLAAMFEEVYFENDRMTTFADEYFVTLGKQRKFAARFLDPGKPMDQGTWVGSVSADTLARMSPDELKLYSGLISDALDALQESRYVTMLAKDSSNAVLSGASLSRRVEQPSGKQYLRQLQITHNGANTHARRPPSPPRRHTWRDFFIHIATIVVGLLIAIGLEQTVEAIHHRHIVRQARENLHQEIERNARLMIDDRRYLESNRNTLLRNITILQQIKANPRQPHEPLHFPWAWFGPSSAAWNTARDTGAVALLPYNVVHGYSLLYGQQQAVEAQANTYMLNHTHASIALVGNENAVNLTPAQIDDLIKGCATSVRDIGLLEALMNGLEDNYKSALRDL